MISAQIGLEHQCRRKFKKAKVVFNMCMYPCRPTCLQNLGQTPKGNNYCGNGMWKIPDIIYYFARKFMKNTRVFLESQMRNKTFTSTLKRP